MSKEERITLHVQVYDHADIDDSDFNPGEDFILGAIAAVPWTLGLGTLESGKSAMQPLFYNDGILKEFYVAVELTIEEFILFQNDEDTQDLVREKATPIIEKIQRANREYVESLTPNYPQL